MDRPSSPSTASVSTLDLDFLDLETSNESLLHDDESTSSCAWSETSSTGSCSSVSELCLTETESDSEGESEMEIEGEQEKDEVLHTPLYDGANVTVIDAVSLMIQFLLR